MGHLPMPLAKELAEFLDGETRVAHNAAHREGIHGIMSWNGQDPRSVRHHSMTSLAQNAESCLLQCGDGAKVIDSGNTVHSLFGP